MKTKYFFIAALAVITLAGCMSDEYVGDSPDASQESVGAIRIGGRSGYLTRATSNTGTVANMLDGQFKVYGVKNVGGYTDVFKNYLVWNNTTKTTSNPDGADTDEDANSSMNGWEYVGTAGSYSGVTTTSNQYIKYWDYSASNYHFVAGSPYANFTFNLTSGDIATATVTGIAGHINPSTTETALTTNPVYIADPVNVPKANYNQEITFSFTRQQAFVRVGVYETIPGYSVSEIKFYHYMATASEWQDADNAKHKNIVLASTVRNYFSGATDAIATLTYDWSGDTPTYTYAYTSGLTTAKNWYGGLFSNGVPATTSTESTVANLYGTDTDMASNGYFTVIPSASALEAQPILIKCDYTLTSLDDSGETIKVTGATAAIPSAFTYWKPNTSYTYLFKISDNTNGSTGTPDTDPAGLFPITFDAVVIAETSGTEQGTITTVTTPSITTYQEGSVTTTGVKYTANKPIYITAADNTTEELNTLVDYGKVVGQVKVYKLTSEQTEADLIVNPPTTTPLSTTLVTSDTTVGNVTLTANKAMSFTPTETGYYAIRYRTVAEDPGAFTYKVIHVE